MPTATSSTPRPSPDDESDRRPSLFSSASLVTNSTSSASPALDDPVIPIDEELSPAETAALVAEDEALVKEVTAGLAKLGESSDLWSAYWRDPSQANTSALVSHYEPFVRGIAERVASRIPKDVDVEDLAQEGFVALLGLIEGFDVSRNTKFETYAAPRLVGAMKDSLRSVDWVPRLVRHRANHVKEVVKQYRNEHGVAPTQDEIVERLGFDQADSEKYLRAALSPSNPRHAGSFRQTRSDRDGQSDDATFDHGSLMDIGPTASMTMENREIVEELMRSLSTRNAQVLRLYLYDERSLREIGLEVGVSESGVSIILRSIILDLRARISEARGTSRGALARELLDEYGVPPEMEDDSGGEVLDPKRAELMDDANSATPAPFTLGSDGTAFQSGGGDEEFQRLVANLKAKQQGASIPTDPKATGGGFYFADGPEPEEE